MFATTKQFLDYFNLESLQQLPALSEIRDMDGGAKDLGFEAELAAARVLEMPENTEEENTAELSEDEKAELLAEEEAIALSQKPLDEILHPNGLPESSEESEELDEQEDDGEDEFAEIDQALSALEQDLGGDPSRLAKTASSDEYEEQPRSEDPESEPNPNAPTE